MGTKAILPFQIAGNVWGEIWRMPPQGHHKTGVVLIKEAESYFHVNLISSQNESVGLCLWDFLLSAGTLIIQNVIHLSLVFANLIETERERECNSHHPKGITLNIVKGQAVVVGDKARSRWWETGSTSKQKTPVLKDTNILIILQHITKQTARLRAGTVIHSPQFWMPSSFVDEDIKTLRVGVRHKWNQEVVHWLFVVFATLTRARNCLLI